MKSICQLTVLLLVAVPCFAEEQSSTSVKSYRWCDPNSEKVRYSSGTVAGFVPCPLPEKSKAKVHRSTGEPSPERQTRKELNIDSFKDFSKGVEAMTDEEKALFAKQIQQLQQKRAADFPKDMMREMQKVMTMLMTDDKFLREAIDEAKSSPELKSLMSSFGKDNSGLKRQIEQLMNNPDDIIKTLRNPQNERMIQEMLKNLSGTFAPNNDPRDKRRYKP